MAYLMQKIGTQEFSILRGHVSADQHLVELLGRPGVDGERKRLLGKRNVPFELISTTTVADMAAGYALLGTYADLVAAVPQAITIDGVLSTTHNFRVLHVRKIDLFAATCLVGNVTPGATAVLICNWTGQLVPV